MDIEFDQWLPDTPAFERPGDVEALNVVPAKPGYRPFQGLATVTDAITARAQGAFFARDLSGAGVIFAGDATKLYTLSGSTWTDVSKVGGYSCPSDGQWQFAQFINDVIAVNGVDPPQVFTLGTSSVFANLGGNPPIGTWIAVTRDFVFIGNTVAGNSYGGDTGPQTVSWCGLGNDATWTQSQTTQADFQTFPDGGRVQALVGGEYLLIIQEFAIRRGNYANVPQVFDFLKFSIDLGGTIPTSVCSYEENTFFIDRSGFYRVSGGQSITSIGEQRVDLYFWENFNQTFFTRMSAAVDPVNSLAVWAFPDQDCNANGDPNHLIHFHWDVDKWAHAQPGNLDMIWSGATQTGYTMETLDSIAPDLDAFTISLDSFSLTGVARRLLSGFDTTHALGYFNGSNLAGEVTTSEVELTPHRRTLLQSVMPIIDGGTPTVTIGYRNRPNDAVTSSSAVTQGADGRCWFDIDARYMRATVDIPAASTWTHLQGLDDAEFRPSSWA